MFSAIYDCAGLSLSYRVQNFNASLCYSFLNIWKTSISCSSIVPLDISEHRYSAESNQIICGRGIITGNLDVDAPILQEASSSGIHFSDFVLLFSTPESLDALPLNLLANRRT
ncbi:hypothetical protein ABKN59_000598 [Abortiporus biennis]